MTIEEASRKYCIPIRILHEYENMKLCKTVKQVMGAWNYDDEDIERLSLIMTLYNTGFSKKDVDEYMQLALLEKNNEKCLKILNQKRKNTLDQIHILEKQLDHLDFLKNEIKKNLYQI